jgi:hypothetical protein
MVTYNHYSNLNIYKHYQDRPQGKRKSQLKFEHILRCSSYITTIKTARRGNVSSIGVEGRRAPQVQWCGGKSGSSESSSSAATSCSTSLLLLQSTVGVLSLDP